MRANGIPRGNRISGLSGGCCSILLPSSFHMYGFAAAFSCLLLFLSFSSFSGGQAPADRKKADRKKIDRS